MRPWIPRTLKLEFKARTWPGVPVLRRTVGESSAFAKARAHFALASSPTRKGYIECSFKSTGKGDAGAARLGVGDTVGISRAVRQPFSDRGDEGPLGGLIAGGIGLAPVRCAIWMCLTCATSTRM